MIETELNANVELSGRNDDRIELIEKNFKSFEQNRNQTRILSSSMVEPGQIEKMNAKIKALRLGFEMILPRWRSRDQKNMPNIMAIE